MLRLAAAALALVVLAGCSLANPLVVGTEVKKVRGADGKIVEPGQMNLEQTRQYAEQIKQAYRGALGDQAQLTAWLGIGLIPLTGAAIGLGAAGGPATAVLASGLTGAAGYGVGTWLINRPRQAAYVAGIKAVTCAEDIVSPLVETDAGALKRDVDALESSIPAVESAIAGLARLLVTFQRDLDLVAQGDRPVFSAHLDLLNEAKAELVTAGSLLSSAESGYAAGRELWRIRIGVAQRLRLAIEKIVDTVDGLIVETQRDPQALAAIINGLGGTFQTLTTVPESVKGVAGKPESRPAPQGLVQTDAGVRNQLDEALPKVAQALKDLRAAEATLNASRRRVTAEVNRVNLAPLLTKLEGCGVKPGDVVVGLTIDPAPPFTMAKGAVMPFDAKGGISPYWASVRGPGDDLTLTQEAPQSRAFTLKTAKEAAPGKYAVTVFDGGGQVKRFDVEIDGGGQKRADAAGATPPAAPGAVGRVMQQFVTDVKGKSATVARVTFEIGEGRPGPDKVSVPVEVKSVGAGFDSSAFTEAAIAVELARMSVNSGIVASQIAIDKFSEVKAKAVAQAPR